MTPEEYKEFDTARKEQADEQIELHRQALDIARYQAGALMRIAEALEVLARRIP